MFTGVVRAGILYLVIIAGVRLMGKRQVGELEPSELVLSLIIADLASVPMQDYGIPLLTGVAPILTLLALTMVLSVGTMKSRRLCHFRDQRPAVCPALCRPKAAHCPADGPLCGGDRPAPGAGERRRDFGGQPAGSGPG